MTTDVHHGLTRRLADHAAGLDLSSVPDEVVRTATTVVTDSLACGIAGSVVAGDVLEPVRALLAGISGPVPSLIGRPLPAHVAALANGTAIHTIDYDDTVMSVVAHLGASITAAALSATHHAGAGGARLLEAVIAGFDVAGRVGEACMPGHYQRFHCTASLGGLGAAAAAARALGLDGAATEQAIGLAADETSGTRLCIKQGDGSKSLHAGLAAERGVRAALLVAAGMRGPVEALEHEVGWFHAYTDEGDARRLPAQMEDLGERWVVMIDDIKAHPCILSSHTAIEGTIALTRDRGIALDDIASVELFQPPYSDRHGLTYEPLTAMAARLSVPYCVAVAVADGLVGMAQFEGDRWLDPQLRRHMAKVTITPDAGMIDRFPGQAPTRTRLTTVDGQVHEVEVGIAKGSHQRPLDEAQLRAKHGELLAYRLPPLKVAGWSALAADVRSLPDVGALVPGWPDLP